MRSTTSIYFIETKEGKWVKQLPNISFFDRGLAKKYLDTLVKNNPPHQFRLCKSTTTETEGPWLSKLKIIHETVQ